METDTSPDWVTYTHFDYSGPVDSGPVSFYSRPVSYEGKVTEMLLGERFLLVSSLYGPGNLFCWFCVLLSVLVSWTLNPRYSRRDTITNDLIAAVTLPLVAAAHFAHQMAVYHPEAEAEWSNLLISMGRRDVQFVAALEAPLTVCESFALISLLFAGIAAVKGQLKRATIVFSIGLICFVPELVLYTNWGGELYRPYEESNLARAFIFQFFPAALGIVAFEVTIVAVYLLEVVYTFIAKAMPVPIATAESGTATTHSRRTRRRTGRLSGLLSMVAAPLAMLVAIWIKYSWASYPSHGFTMRFVPKGLAHLRDLDQAVTALGGLLTLAFSLHDAAKSRCRGHRGLETL